MKGKITRERDGLVKRGNIGFIEWGEDNRFKKLHDKPKVGYSIIVNPQAGIYYTWLTSTITEIVSDTEIKTKNSNYKIEYEK